MYITRDSLKDNVTYPDGSFLTVLGNRLQWLENGFGKYCIKDKIEDGTRFVFVVEGKDFALNAHRACLENIPFSIVGTRPESVFLDDVLWRGTSPFVANVDSPQFILKEGIDERADLEFCVRLAFALGEKITEDILFSGKSSLVFPNDFTCVEFVKNNGEGLLPLLNAVKGRVDGLKQTESALTLLKIKEKNAFRREDYPVLLAKYLAKVYNYFIRYKPLSLFAPNNLMRAEIMEEFFGVRKPCPRKILSEFEIRKRYYMLSENAEVLSVLWERILSIIDGCFSQHRKFVTNHGFCMEEICDDAKFSVFLSPDLLHGDTLLSFIKDCGLADNFL